MIDAKSRQTGFTTTLMTPDLSSRQVCRAVAMSTSANLDAKGLVPRHGCRSQADGTGTDDAHALAHADGGRLEHVEGYAQRFDQAGFLDEPFR